MGKEQTNIDVLAKAICVFIISFMLLGFLAFFLHTDKVASAADSGLSDYGFGELLGDCWENEDSIWKMPLTYGERACEEIPNSDPPTIQVSNPSAQPGDTIEFVFKKNYSPFNGFVYIQVPDALTDVHITGDYGEGDNVQEFDFTSNLPLEDSYDPAHHLYRMQGEQQHPDGGMYSYDGVYRDFYAFGEGEYTGDAYSTPKELKDLTIRIRGNIPTDFDISQPLRVRVKYSALYGMLDPDAESYKGPGSWSWQFFPYLRTAFAEKEFKVGSASPLPSITVNTSANNNGVSYNGIKLFDGIKNANGTMSDIKWHDPGRFTADVRKRIYEALDLSAIDYEDDAAFLSDSHRVADAMSHMIEDNSKNVDESSESYLKLMTILSAVWDSGSSFQFPTNEPYHLSDGGGYYVFYSDLFKNQDALTPGRTIGSPVFMAIGSNESAVINEKVPSVSVTKWICDSEYSGKQWKETSASIGEEIPFKLEGILPSNVNDFALTGKAFSYSFIDSYNPLQMAVEENSFEVYNGEQKVTDYVKKIVDNENGMFRIDIENLQAIPNIDLSKNIEVRYIGKLLDGAVIGSAGNINTVHVEYSASPSNDIKNRTPIDRVAVYTFDLNITKSDSTSPSNRLKGAVFSVTGVASADDTNTSAPIKLSSESDADGKAVFHGIGSLEQTDGRHAERTYYRIEEPTAPEGFLSIDPIYISVQFDYATHKLSCEIVNDTNLPALATLIVNEQNDDVSGTINMGILDIPFYLLPVTGMRGATLLCFVGIAFIAIATAMQLRKKHKRL